MLESEIRELVGDISKQTSIDFERYNYLVFEACLRRFIESTHQNNKAVWLSSLRLDVRRFGDSARDQYEAKLI